MRLLQFLVIAVFVALAAAMTEDEKAKLRAAADEADLSIRHIDVGKLKAAIASGVHVLLFGVQWCKITQRQVPYKPLNEGPLVM